MCVIFGVMCWCFSSILYYNIYVIWYMCYLV